MTRTLTPIIYTELCSTNGVYSLYRAEEQTPQTFAIEHFPTRELVETFTDETEARDFFNEACLSSAQGCPVQDAESTVSLTLIGCLAVAGIDLRAERGA